MRPALHDSLIVLSPVAALRWVLPQTQGWFRWWADLFPITVFQRALQVMVLSPRQCPDDLRRGGRSVEGNDTLDSRRC